MDSKKVTSPVRRTLGPLLLILVCPPFAMLLWYTNTQLGGSLAALWNLVISGNAFEPWREHAVGSPLAWMILALFTTSQLLMMRFIPGKRVLGPVTPQGNIPVYKDNGLISFLITIGLFVFCSFGLELFPASILYDHLGDVLGALNLFSLCFCLLLMLKGRFFPSTSDCGSSGNLLFDYYWGTELYPRICGFDLKQWTNCRFGMMSWGILVISYAAKQSEIYGLSDGMVVSVLLQLLYITKFFAWEVGYLRSMDIQHDRAGFYICWGCLVWVPAVYTSPAMFLVHHPITLGPAACALIFALGAGGILVNYLADLQRKRFRETGGQISVWGRLPVVTEASYQTADGEPRTALLLASGWWGIARHFHYIPELLGALAWSLPALGSGVLGYFYVIFLAVLLVDRSVRDDNRCKLKYGLVWAEHCRKVPYKMIPKIF